MRRWFLSVLFVLWLSASTNAQEKAFVEVKKFDNVGFTYRNNFCDRQRELYRGNIELARALDGMNVTVAMTRYTEPYEDGFFNLDGEGRIPAERPGLFVKIMDELANRAGFNWRDSFVALDPIDADTDGKNWTDLLEWSVQSFDVSVDNWAKTTSRMRLGVAFPEGWYDASLIMVERVDKSSEEVNMWSFLTPFRFPVWAMIFVSVIATGIMYWVLERLNSNADEAKLENKPLTTIFLSSLTFTGHFDFQPNTHSAKMLSFSWTFFCLLVVSAYTANLASFLVAKQTPQFSIQSIEQAVRWQVPVCVLGASNQDELLVEKYPNIQLVRKRSARAVYDGLNNGDCKIAASPVNTYELYVRTTDVNKDCLIKSPKRVIEIIPAGIATAVDSGTRCTSLVDNVIDLHLTQMKAEKFIEGVWNAQIQRVGDQSCLAEESIDKGLTGGEDDSETVSLSLEEMAGIFILHGILASIALFIALVHFFLVRKEDPKAMLQKLGLKDDVGEDDTESRELPRHQQPESPASVAETQVKKVPRNIPAPNDYWD